MSRQTDRFTRLDEPPRFHDAVCVQIDAKEHCRTTGPRKRPALMLLAVIVFIALPVRLYLSFSAAMISRDGVTFIWYARHLAQDPLHELRAQAQHPLYPTMILAAHSTIQAVGGLLRPLSGGLRAVLDDPVQSWTLAGMSVTLLGGLAVVWAAYALAARLFNRRVGLWTAVLTALTAEFCQLSADALTDMPHLAIYLFALYAAMRGLWPDQSRDREGAENSQAAHPPPLAWGWLLLCGVFSGLAYLMRPEGAGAAVVAAAACLAWVRKRPLARRLAGAAIIAAGAIAVASPYMIVTGKLIQKKPVTQFFKNESPAAATRLPDAPMQAASPMVAGLPAQAAQAVGLVFEHWGRTLRATMLLPAVLWLVLRRRRPAQPHAAGLVLSAGGLHFAILTALILRFDYADSLSVRHTAILAGLTLPFSAAGAALIVDMFRPARRKPAGILLAVALVAPTAPWLFERRFADELYLRQAGQWLREQQPAEPKIQTTRHPVAFYANGVCQWSPREADATAVARILAEARDNHPDWLVFDRQRMLGMSPSFLVDLEKAARPGELERAPDLPPQTVKGKLQRVLIYRYHPPI